MLKKIMIVLVCFFTPIVMAAQVNTLDPYARTKIDADKVFSRINQQLEQAKQNPDMLKQIVTQDLLPSVHVKYAAALALGEQYKNLSKTEREAYFAAFENYLTHAFAQALAMYNGQTYQVESSKNIGDRNIVSVRVLLMNNDKSQQPIRIDFQWRKNTVTGEWQAYDLVIEGVSMLTTKQSEWTTIIQQKGINALIDNLNQQANQRVTPAQTDNANQ